MVVNLHNFRSMLLIIIIPILFSCATTQQKQVEARDAEFYFNRGLTCYEKGQYDLAISDYTKALDINPRLALAFYSRAIAYGKKGQFDQAISDYTKALEIDPRYAEAYNNRGKVYWGKGQFDQAISDFNKAIEINPKDARAYNNRGVAYYYKSEYEKSWKDIEKAQSLGFQVNPEFLDKLHGASGSPPDEARLRLRFQDVHTAMWSGDAKTFYEMTTPRFRSEKWLEDIKKDMEKGKKSPQPARRVSLEQICSCRSHSDKMGKSVRCVLLVSFTEDKPGGSQLRLLEIWEYIDREWYYMGAPGEGDKCP